MFPEENNVKTNEKHNNIPNQFIDLPSIPDIDDEDGILADNEQLKSVVEHLTKLLPSVTKYLSEQDKLEEWITFFHLVSEGNFNLNNIAVQLFWDVVKFHKIKNIHAMRFSSDVKKFWTLGLQLFHSKFIRFMGGYKSVGQLASSSVTTKQDMTPETAHVNFVCPHVNQLRQEKKNAGVDCSTPGIIESNLDVVAATSNNRAYKICIDGKKIAPGFGSKLGEVDLYGHESSPTLKQKQDRLAEEIDAIDDIDTLLCQAELLEKEFLEDLTQEDKRNLSTKAIDVIRLLSLRIRDLRESQCKKRMALDKLMAEAGEFWMKSKYCYSISSIKTLLHRMGASVIDLLSCIDRLGLVAAACNNSLHLYETNRVIDLSLQENYVCLKDAPDSMDSSQIPSDYTKQRSNQWFSERKKAKVTGSTIHKALGLNTLKEQQQHYDRVVNGKITTESPADGAMNRAMEHGTLNEINGMGVAIGKLLPVYLPNAVFYEEGFYRIRSHADENFLIVSPDGSCRENEVPIAAIEIKCPLPGKTVVPDVQYKIPDYYVCQILSEMVAFNCTSLFYVCWTPESTTVFQVHYDDDLWGIINQELIGILQGQEMKPLRPKRKSPNISVLKSLIKDFKEERVHFLGEFPSLLSSPCCHTEDIHLITELRGQHGSQKCTTSNRSDVHELAFARQFDQTRILETQRLVATLKHTLHEAYNVLRTPAKEVVVAVISDMDRIKKAEQVHAIPIAYGLSGYSLPVASIRGLVTELLEICYNKGIYVCALSSDGQFYQMSVRDAENKPLTVLQVAKDTWDKVRKISKSEQIKELMKTNFHAAECAEDLIKSLDFKHQHDLESGVSSGFVIHGWKHKTWETLYTPVDFRDLVRNTASSNAQVHGECHGNGDDIPCNQTDDINKYTQHASWESNNNECDMESERHWLHDEPYADDDIETFLQAPERPTSDDMIPRHVLTAILSDLRKGDASRKKAKWFGADEDKLYKLLVSNGKIIAENFTQKELVVCYAYLNESSTSAWEKMKKTEIVNMITSKFDNEPLPGKLKSPKSLRLIIKDLFSRKYNKQAINAITATNKFVKNELPEWRRNNPAFNTPTTITNENEPYVWYCQPEYFEANKCFVQYLLDCHHLFVNARCHVCQHGIPGLDVNKEAWIEVAEDNKNTNVGLNIAMVKDMIDRQSNSIAQIVFGDKVEADMRSKGWMKEAEFCRRIRRWYAAEDEPGISARDRHKARMEMREMVLSAINLAKFPPPGLTIGGMTTVMFEGILTNIDRRTQLYALVPDNAYNVRAPTSLDAENLFSEFQELDPKSSGTLMADDIPAALETASYIMQMRLNPDR